MEFLVILAHELSAVDKVSLFTKIIEIKTIWKKNQMRMNLKLIAQQINEETFKQFDEIVTLVRIQG